MRRNGPPPEPAAQTHVEICAGGHQVIVESAGCLDTVAAKALELWKATDSAAVTGSVGVVGFHTSDPSSFPESPDQEAHDVRRRY